jgi:hypothetical protein
MLWKLETTENWLICLPTTVEANCRYYLTAAVLSAWKKVFFKNLVGEGCFSEGRESTREN